MTEPATLVNGTTPWYHLADVIAVLQQLDESSWLSDPQLKYIGLRVDTRTKQVLLTDRNGLVITLSEVAALRTRQTEALLGRLEVVVGLRDQGHLPTVERMLADGASWLEIGKAIGWDGPTAQVWYLREFGTDDILRADGSCCHGLNPAIVCSMHRGPIREPTP